MQAFRGKRYILTKHDLVTSNVSYHKRTAGPIAIGVVPTYAAVFELPVTAQNHEPLLKYKITLPLPLFNRRMRRELAKQEGQRKRFRATFIRLGKKTNYQGYSEETILLNRVIDAETGTVVTDHLWFSYTKGFQDARMQEGDTIEFEARVKEYRKGYVNRAYGINNRKQDYKLSHPTRIAVVNDPSGR